MMVMISVGSVDMGAIALRRHFNSRIDSSNDLISTSMTCC